MGLMALRRRCLMYHPKSHKNLLNVDDSLKLAYSTYTNWTGADGTATVTGNANGGYIVACEPNTTYTYSHRCSYSGGKLSWRVWEYTTRPTTFAGYTAMTLNTSTGTSQTITTRSDTTYMLVGFFVTWQSSWAPALIIDQMQLELGSEATPYEPYQD